MGLAQVAPFWACIFLNNSVSNQAFNKGGFYGNKRKTKVSGWDKLYFQSFSPEHNQSRFLAVGLKASLGVE